MLQSNFAELKIVNIMLILCISSKVRAGIFVQLFRYLGYIVDLYCFKSLKLVFLPFCIPKSFFFWRNFVLILTNCYKKYFLGTC
jgi:hypothetical protein